VPPGPLFPPAADRALGLGFYLSTTPGVGGRTKATADAFRVGAVEHRRQLDRGRAHHA
jgi:hypothetical protein